MASLGRSGHPWASLGFLGSGLSLGLSVGLLAIRTYGITGHLWASLGLSGLPWASLGLPGPLWASGDPHLWHHRASLGLPGPLRPSPSLSVAICLALYLPLSRLLSLLLVLHRSVSGSPPGSLWLLLHIPFRLSLSSSGYLYGSLSLALTAFLLLYMALSCFLLAPSRLSLLLLSVSMHPPRLFSV